MVSPLTNEETNDPGSPGVKQKVRKFEESMRNSTESSPGSRTERCKFDNNETEYVTKKSCLDLNNLDDQDTDSNSDQDSNEDQNDLPLDIREDKTILKDKAQSDSDNTDRNLSKSRLTSNRTVSGNLIYEEKLSECCEQHANVRPKEMSSGSKEKSPRKNRSEQTLQKKFCSCTTADLKLKTKDAVVLRKNSDGSVRPKSPRRQNRKGQYYARKCFRKNTIKESVQNEKCLVEEEVNSSHTTNMSRSMPKVEKFHFDENNFLVKRI